MIIYIVVGLCAFLAGILFGLFIARGRTPASRQKKLSRRNLNRFNFDKQKRYEKEGRKYPFSY